MAANPLREREKAVLPLIKNTIDWMVKGSVTVVDKKLFVGVFFLGGAGLSLVCFSLENKTLGKEDVVVYLLKAEHVAVLALLPSKQQTCCCSLLLM